MKTRTWERILSMVLVVLMVFSLMPTAAFADYETEEPAIVEAAQQEPPAEEPAAEVPAEEEPIEETEQAPLFAADAGTNGYSWDTLVFTREDSTPLAEGTDYTVNHKTYYTYDKGYIPYYNEYTIKTTDSIVISGGGSYQYSSSATWKCTVIMGTNADSNVTLNGVTCLGSLSAQTGYTMNVTLAGTNYVDSILGDDGASASTSLVFGGNGELNGKHIGGSYGSNKTAAEITINSGVYKLDVGSERYAAIGGGYSGSESAKSYADGITINGGTFTLNGGGYAAAIGGGQYGDASNITINDGVINATVSRGAAIGGGMGQDDSMDASALGMTRNIVINGGTITASSQSAAVIGGGLYAGADGITINGGTITATVASQSAYTGAAIGGGAPFTSDYTTFCYPPASNISINGGTIVASVTGTTAYSKSFTGNVLGCGVFNNTGSNRRTADAVNVAITGGSFNYDPSKYVSTDYKVENNEGVYTVRLKNPAAGIGTKEYASLPEAISAAKDGDTVVMLADYAASDTLTINKAITIDGQRQYKIHPSTPSYFENQSSEITAASSAKPIISLKKDGITLKNLTVEARAFSRQDLDVSGCTVTLNNVTLDHQDHSSRGNDSIQLNGKIIVENSLTIKLGACLRYYNDSGTNFENGKVIQSWGGISFNSDNSAIEFAEGATFTGIDVPYTDGTRGYNQAFIHLYNSKGFNKTGIDTAFANITGSVPSGLVKVIGTGWSMTGYEVAGSELLKANYKDVIDGVYYQSAAAAKVMFPDGITKGTFYDDPTAYLARGYKAVKSGEVWTIEALPVVATMGETHYYSIKEAVDAFNAATDEGEYTITIKEGTWAVADTMIKQSTTKSLKIQGETGKTVTLTYDAANGQYGRFFMVNGGSSHSTLKTEIVGLTFDMSDRDDLVAIWLMGTADSDGYSNSKGLGNEPRYSSNLYITNCAFTGPASLKATGVGATWRCNPSGIYMDGCSGTNLRALYSGYVAENVNGLTITDATLTNCAKILHKVDNGGVVVMENVEATLTYTDSLFVKANSFDAKEGGGYLEDWGGVSAISLGHASVGTDILKNVNITMVGGPATGNGAFVDMGSGYGINYKLKLEGCTFTRGEGCEFYDIAVLAKNAAHKADVTVAGTFNGEKLAGTVNLSTNIYYNFTAFATIGDNSYLDIETAKTDATAKTGDDFTGFTTGIFAGDVSAYTAEGYGSYGQKDGTFVVKARAVTIDIPKEVVGTDVKTEEKEVSDTKTEGNLSGDNIPAGYTTTTIATGIAKAITDNAQEEIILKALEYNEAKGTKAETVDISKNVEINVDYNVVVKKTSDASGIISFEAHPVAVVTVAQQGEPIKQLGEAMAVSNEDLNGNGVKVRLDAAVENIAKIYHFTESGTEIFAAAAGEGVKAWDTYVKDGANSYIELTVTEFSDFVGLTSEQDANSVASVTTSSGVTSFTADLDTALNAGENNTVTLLKNIPASSDTEDGYVMNKRGTTLNMSGYAVAGIFTTKALNSTVKNGTFATLSVNDSTEFTNVTVTGSLTIDTDAEPVFYAGCVLPINVSDYVADGCVCIQDGSVYKVVNAVAQVGTNYYGTLTEAITALGTDGTKTMTILGDYTTQNITWNYSTPYFYNNTQNAELAENAGVVIVRPGYDITDIDVPAGVTLLGNGNTVTGTMSIPAGAVTVSGFSFTKADGAAISVVPTDKNTATVTVSYNSFAAADDGKNNLVVGDKAQKGNATVYVQNNSTAVSYAEADFGDTAATTGTVQASAWQTITAQYVVAQVNTQKYATMKAAYDVAKGSDTPVKLIDDVIISEAFAADGSAILDLNGKELNVTAAGSVTVAENKTLKIVDNRTGGKVVADGSFTVNGTLDISTLGYGETGLVSGKSGTMTVGANGLVKLPAAFEQAGWTMEMVAKGNYKFLQGAVGAKAVLGSTTYICVVPGTDTTAGVWVEEGSKARIGYQGYTSLEAALADAKTGDVINLLADAEVEQPINVNKSLTVESNPGAEYTITAADDFTGVMVFYGETGADLTLKNITVDANNECRVIRMNAGKLTLDNANVTNGKAASYIGGVYMTGSSEFVMKNGSEITGNSNTTTEPAYLAYSADLWIGSEAKGTIEGGKVGNVFVNSNEYSKPAAGLTQSGGAVTNVFVEWDGDKAASFTKTGGTVTKLYIAQDNAYPHVAALKAIANPSDGTYAASDAVAMIGDVKYSSINEAFAAVNGMTGDNVTLTVMSDVSDEAITNDYTFSKNLTVTATSAKTINFNNKAFQVSDKKTIVVAKDITLTNVNTFGMRHADGTAEIYGTVYALYIKVGCSEESGDGHFAKLIIHKGAEVYETATGSGSIRPNSNAEVIIEGTTDSEFPINGDDPGDRSITLKDATFSAWDFKMVDSTGGKVVAKLEKSTINGMNGEFNFAGGALVGTLTMTDSTVNGTGTVTVGADDTVSMDAASAFAVGTFSNASTNFGMKAGAKITAANISNTGTITVDMTGATADSYTIIDYTGTTAKTLADYGTVTLSDHNYQLKVVDNDLVAVKAEAYVGDLGFEKFEDAMAYAQSNATATTPLEVGLLTDVTVEAQINVTDGVTINGNNHKITANSEATWPTSGGEKVYLLEFNILNSLNEVGSVSDVGVKNVTLDSNHKTAGVQAFNANNVTLENVSILNGKKAGFTVNASTVTLKGNITISGNGWGDYINVGKGSQASVQPILTVAEGAVLSTGADGTRIGIWMDKGDVAKIGAANITSTVTGTGYTMTKDGDGYSYVDAQTVAKVGNTYYTTVAAAVAAAASGGTVKLLADTAITSMITLNKSITLDLNGKTLNTEGRTASWVQIVNNAALTIDGTGEGSAAYGRINVGKSGTNGDGNLVINGGTYAVGNGQTVIHVNGDCTDSDVSITDAIITSADDNGIQLNGKGTFVITGSTIEGGTGIYIKAGELTLTGSTVTGNKTPVDYSYNGNGANATGDAIVIDACNYPGGNPTITIGTGNTITGTKNQVGYYQSKGTGAELGTADVTTSDKTLTVPAGYAWNKDGKLVKAEAKIGDKYYATVVEAVNAAKGNADPDKADKVELLMDASGAGLFITSAQNGVSIDLGGHTYKVTGPAVGSAGTESQGVHIEAAQFGISNGTLTSDCDKVLMLVQNYSNLTLYGVTLDGTKLPGSNRYVLSNNSGYTYIRNTTINAKAGDFAFDVCRYSDYAHVAVEVKDGSVINGKIEVSGNIAEGQSADLKLIDGDFTKAVFSATTEGANVTKKDSVVIAAPTGYFWENGTTLKAIAAKIGDDCYASFVGAFAASKSGDTITLCADVELASTLNITNKLTIDGQGTYKITPADSFSGDKLISGNASADITLKDVTVDAEAAEGTAKLRVIYVADGKLTIDGATVKGGNAGTSYIGGIYMTGTSEFVMTSGSVKGNVSAKTDYLKYANDLWIGSQAKGTVTGGEIGNAFVNSNTYATTPNGLELNGGKIDNVFAEWDTANKATFTYTSGECTNVIMAMDDADTHAYFNEVTPVAGTTYTVTPVAEINGTKYASIYDAVAAAKTGETVKVIGNVTLTEALTVSGKDITIDLNGKTVTGDNAGKRIVVASDAKLTLKDTAETKGALVGGSTGSSTIVKVEGEFTLDGAVIKDTVYGVGSFGNGKITVNSGSVTAKYYAVSTNGSTVTSAAITLNGGEFTSTEDSAVYLPSGTLTVPAASTAVVTGATAVYVKGGKTEIAGGSFNANGAAAAYAYVGGGSNPTGDAFVVENCDYPAAPPTVAITGGEFYSANAEAVASYGQSDTYKAITGFVTGGKFSGEPTDYLKNGYALNAISGGKYICEAVVAESKVTADNVGGTPGGDAAPEQKNEAKDNVIKDIVDNFNKTGESDIQDKIGSGKKVEVKNGENNEEKTLGIDDSTRIDINLESVEISVNTDIAVQTGYMVATKTASYDVKPIAVITTTIGGVETTEEFVFTNKWLKDNHVTLKFTLPVPDTMAGDSVLVIHTKDDNSVEQFTKSVEEDGQGNRFVTIEATEFSNYTLSQQNEANSKVKIVTGADEKIYFYNTLAEAISDAQNGDTIALLAASVDETFEVSGKTLILDLNGKTLENTDGIAVDISGTVGKLTIIDSSADKAGKVNGVIITEDNNVVIKEGTFDVEPDDEWIDDYSKVTENTDSWKVAYDANIVAKVGTTKFTSLQKAIAAAQKGGTVVLLKNLEKIAVTVNATYDVTLDPNGFTVKGTKTITNKGSLTIVGEGRIEGTEYALSTTTGLTSVKGGEFVGSIVKSGTGKYAISGGIFNKEILDEDCAAGYASFKMADGKYTVAITSYIIETASLADSNYSIANVSGAGEYVAGSTVTLEATTTVGYLFDHWEFNGENVSSDATYTFAATQSGTYTAVYTVDTNAYFRLTVNANRTKIAVGEAAATDEYGNVLNRELNINSKVKVTFVPEDGEKFLYWADPNGAILGKEATIQIYMTSDRTLVAYTTKNSTAGSTVVYSNGLGQIISSRYYAAGTEVINQPRINPTRPGYTFNKWQFSNGKDATDATIKALLGTSGNEFIVITPLWDKIEANIIVTVKYVGVDHANTEISIEGSKNKDIAPEVEDVEGVAVFDHWEIGGQIASYQRSFTVYSPKDIELTAVYTKTGAAVVMPTVAHQGMTKSLRADGAYQLVNTVSMTLPEGYTLVARGYVFSKYTADANTLRVENVSGETVRLQGAELKDNTIFQFVLNVKDSKLVYNFRGYLTYKDNANNVYTIYSDVVSACYDSIQ